MTASYTLLSVCLILAQLEGLPDPHGQRAFHGSADRSAADLAWYNLNEIWRIDAVGSIGIGSRASELALREKQALAFRSEGLKYCAKFPHDSRRWEWLRRTVQFAPRYWEVVDEGAALSASGKPHLASTNTMALLEWRRVYQALRTAFFSAPEVTEEMRRGLRYDELRCEIRELNYTARRNEPIDAVDVVTKTMDFLAETPEQGNRENIALVNELFRYLERDQRAEAIILRRLTDLSDSELRWLGNGREQIVRLRNRPIDLEVMSMDGTRLNLAAMRGKVILLSFWATSCRGCVASLPRLKAVYNKYYKQGFDIIGITFDEEQNRERIARLTRELQIRWPLSLQGKLNGNPLADRFAIIGYPVYFLVDQSGYLVTNDVKGDRLEAEVRRLLGLPQMDNRRDKDDSGS